MSSPFRFSLPLFKLLLILSLIISISNAQSLAKQRRFNNSVSAIFVFGDSTVDSGNNNYIETLFKSNFPPYGRDIVNHIPTGRFTNGRLVTDFIASYAGVKDYVPPYLDPTLGIEELMTGVSFASACSGFDPLTPQLSGVISLQRQLELFREYRTRLEVAIGKERTRSLIDKAVFIVSSGTNDFVVNYFGTSVRRQTYNVSGYQNFLMNIIQRFIQSLLEQGALKIAMVGLPPMGCLPVVITLNSPDPFNQRECIETLSSVARDYNQLLKNNLKAMQKSNTTFIYADIYTPLSNMIQWHTKYGFDEVNTGCCGTGFLEASVLCNAESPVCSDASKYVFWDSIHPTEKAYYTVFMALRSIIDLVLKE